MIVMTTSVSMATLVVVLNISMLNAMVIDAYSVFVWYIIYELSIIGILPYLTIEGRSYRRANALLITLIVTMLSTCMMVILCM